jgi:cytochrome c6
MHIICKTFIIAGVKIKTSSRASHLADGKMPELKVRKQNMKKTFITGAILSIAMFAANATFAADGKALYEQHCVKCHGADGKGETKMGKKLEAKDYSLAKNWEGLTDAKAIKSVKEGFKDKDGKQIMKPAEGVNDADAKAIVDYMKTLKK